ncbi:hypothetical protein V5O48_003177 [Marasmius crinis-equi]|uniref:Thioredoxin-like fold domain-containing protein n=1 Tax=Marasmius crinis-equi TaxID=585013 RepID=A0ABR3FTK9_9AGAR
MSLAIENILRPLFNPGGKYAGKVKVMFRNQVQPWHSSSTFVHEAGLAVARIAPEHFWAFSLALFKNQEEYFDIPTSTLTPLQIREKLSQLAAYSIQQGSTPVNRDPSPRHIVPQLIGGNGIASEVGELLKLKSSPNGGVDVTDDLKYTVKFSRQNGIHVSPTVLWDGIVAGEVSSGWGEKEWLEFLEKKVQV